MIMAEVLKEFNYDVRGDFFILSDLTLLAFFCGSYPEIIFFMKIRMMTITIGDKIFSEKIQRGRILKR
jgi:hypothetical protein